MSAIEFVGASTHFNGTTHDVSFSVSPATWVEIVSLHYTIAIDQTVSGTRSINVQLKDAAGNILCNELLITYTATTPSSGLVDTTIFVQDGGSFSNNVSRGARLPPGGSIHLVDVNGVAPATDSIALVAVFDTV
jgi:hypothetical protein